MLLLTPCEVSRDKWVWKRCRSMISFRSQCGVQTVCRAEVLFHRSGPSDKQPSDRLLTSDEGKHSSVSKHPAAPFLPSRGRTVLNSFLWFLQSDIVHSFMKHNRIKKLLRNLQIVVCKIKLLTLFLYNPEHVIC